MEPQTKEISATTTYHQRLKTIISVCYGSEGYDDWNDKLNIHNMSDIRSDEQCHIFVQIQGTLTKPFRVLYTDNHSTTIPQFSSYEGGNNFYVLQGSFYTGLIISNPHVEINQLPAKAGTLYIDAQFTYTDKSITSLSQPGFDFRLFGSSFDQSSKDIELNKTEINNLKTRVSNIPATEKASQSEVNDGTNEDKFITLFIIAT